jgi:hypothetical protein
VIVGHGGQTGRPMTSVMMLLQSLDHTNVQAMALTTIHTTPLAAIFPKHSLRRTKGEAMGMTTIHTTPLGTIPSNI